MRRHTQTFTATTLNGFVAPGGVTEIEVEGFGGGSGGAGGGGGGVATNVYALGGAGGAGPVLSRRRIPVTPGVSYDVVIGAGGGGGLAAGNATASPDRGNKGGDSLFRINGGAVLETFHGASATGAPVGTTAVTNSFTVYHGALPTRQRITTSELGDEAFLTTWAANDYGIALQSEVPGAGGAGCTNNNNYRAGRDSIQGYRGGLSGTRGANGTGNYRGGGPGGGGGAGPAGDGGTGGNATAGNGAGSVSGAATAGGAASANTGAGGGGGGGAGCTSVSPTGNDGGGGGNGGSGRITIVWYV